MQNTAKKEKVVRVTARMPESKRDEATDIANTLGFDLNTAINIFIAQLIRTKSIPFDLISPNASELEIGLAELKAGHVDRFESKEKFFDYLDQIAESAKNDNPND